MEEISFPENDQTIEISLSLPTPVYSTFSARATLFTFFLFPFFLSFLFFFLAGAIGYDVKIRAAVSRSGSKLSLPGGEKSVPRARRWETVGKSGSSQWKRDLSVVVIDYRPTFFSFLFFLINFPSLSLSIDLNAETKIFEIRYTFPSSIDSLPPPTRRKYPKNARVKKTGRSIFLFLFRDNVDSRIVRVWKGTER